ncbi:MAG: hypothetical protein NC102_01675, partial [Clostridium sp.]|nr:hypothetical protein [Clostridium sp.]
ADCGVLSGLTDFGPRWLSAGLGSWMAPDPQAESYPGVSPYAYCAGNPVRHVDPTGEDIWTFDRKGYLVDKIVDERTIFQIQNNDDNSNHQSIELSSNAVEDYFKSKTKDDHGVSLDYECLKIRGDKESTALFEFFAKNTDVEWSQAKTGFEETGPSYISTSHMHDKEAGMTHMINHMLIYGYTVREINHSHPENSAPSKSDHNFASKYGFLFEPNPVFKVYQPSVKTPKGFGRYVEFSPVLGNEFIVTPF